MTNWWLTAAFQKIGANLINVSTKKKKGLLHFFAFKRVQQIKKIWGQTTKDFFIQDTNEGTVEQKILNSWRTLF
jgi:hypothetical protein